MFNLQVDDYKKSDFSLMLKLASKGASVYALDYAGYGLSDDAIDTEDIDTCIEQVIDVVNFVAMNHPKNPIIVGWSWSGQVVARLAQEHPDCRISGMVYWGAQWGGGNTGRPRFVNESYLYPTVRRKNTENHAGADFKTPDSYLKTVKDQFIEYSLKLDPSSPTYILREIYQKMPMYDPSRIATPVLVVYGKQDHVVIKQDIEAFFDALSSTNKKLVELRGGDHNVQLGHYANDLVDSIEDFMRTL